jgi:hypothetical protein
MSDKFTTKDVLKNVDSPAMLKKVVETLLNQKLCDQIDQKKQEMSQEYLKDKQ